MIHVDLSATARCGEKDCAAEVKGGLVLSAVGALRFQPEKPEDTTGWQMLMEAGNPASPVQMRCPKHRSEVHIPQLGPAGPRLVKPNGH